MGRVMTTRQRKATGFLILACLVILICMAQRVASLHALPAQSVAASLSVAPPDSNESAPLTPCEISAKTLLVVPPLLFDGAVPAPDILLAVLALLCALPFRFPPVRARRAPLLRIHLINCNFRE